LEGSAATLSQFCNFASSPSSAVLAALLALLFCSSFNYLSSAAGGGGFPHFPSSQFAVLHVITVLQYSPCSAVLPVLYFYSSAYLLVIQFCSSHSFPSSPVLRFFSNYSGPRSPVLQFSQFSSFIFLQLSQFYI
jgi:hypothetical protein